MTRLLSKLAAEDPDQTVSASFVSAALDISTAIVRRTLSALALRGLLRPKLVMVCSKCGTDNDEAEPGETPVTAFCHVCGAREPHNPVVVFELGEALRRAARSPADPPKLTGRMRTKMPLTIVERDEMSLRRAS